MHKTARSLPLTFLLSLAAAACAQDLPGPGREVPYESFEAVSKGNQLEAWSQRTFQGKTCYVSPVLDSPRGTEVNHHHVTVAYTGSGSVQVAVARSPSNSVSDALSTRRRHSSLRTVKSKQEVRFYSPYQGDRYVWVIFRPVGDVRIQGVRYRGVRGEGLVYGHKGYLFPFARSKLPYRLLYPADYDPNKSYPLVISVHGSGGVGVDNKRNMEMVILARRLYVQYWFEEELACFSLVPQIPPLSRDGVIPAPYHPKGPKGAPDPPWHPDWPAVNENSWYTQGTLALIQSLIDNRDINIDPDRVYYTGFSYGGKATWEFLKAGRTVFAGAMCGAGWPIGGAYSRPRGKMLDRLAMEVERYKHIPVWIFAGEKDGMRYGSEAVHELIRKAGGTSKLTIFPDTGHVSSAGRTWNNPDHVNWLFQQNRRKNPDPGPDPYPDGDYGESDE